MTTNPPITEVEIVRETEATAKYYTEQYESLFQWKDPQNDVDDM